jgi:CheY-like chemotaxis protein
MTDVKHPEYVDELKREFIDEVVETLQSLDVDLDSVRHGRGDEAALVDGLRRLAVQTRGQANNYGLRPLSMVANRLHDYLADAPTPLPPRAPEDLQAFIDMMLLHAQGHAPDNCDLRGMVRVLPPKLGFNLGEIQVRDIEVMLVMPPGIQTRFVERELQQCGYRVSVVSDTIDAFAHVIQAQPDMIIVSAIMPHLDGIDLAIALVSMPATRNIPIAVITALDDDDERLQLLPRKVPVLHKGPSFGDDLFKALDNLFLI